MLFAVLIFLISFFFLSRSGGRAVRSLVALVRTFGLSEYVVAFVVMSFATSIPELFVGISSAVGRVPGFSFGNVLGSNLINLTLVIGIIALVSGGLDVGSRVSKRNFWVILVLSFLPILVAYDGVISRTDGIGLLVSFVFYLWRIIGERRYFANAVDAIRINPDEFKNIIRSLATVVLSVAVLLMSSALLIWSGSRIASSFNINPFIFGLIFISLGTTLPELVFGLKASTLKHTGLTVGNAVGSVAFNALFITGIVAVIHPIVVPFTSIILVAFFLAVGFTLFNIFVYSRSKISKREAIILISTYIAFLLIGNIL